jgi:hypothetical protein
MAECGAVHLGTVVASLVTAAAGFAPVMVVAALALGLALAALARIVAPFVVLPAAVAVAVALVVGSFHGIKVSHCAAGIKPAVSL